MHRTFAFIALALSLPSASIALRASVPEQGKMKTETFDVDPNWHGINNRSARMREPITIRQDFGYTRTANAGGKPGEIGGFITPAGEAAFYGKVIKPQSLETPLSASGTFSCPDGGFHLLIGFFNADTINEWRTPNTLAIRLNGRGDHFFAYVEYCTSKWRAGGDSTPFPSKKDPQTGRSGQIGFPSGGRVYHWSLTYDPAGNDNKGIIKATINNHTAICLLDEGHRADGAVFNRFGILNVIKSFDNPGEAYFDDITINGVKESFDSDPKWDGRNNRRTYRTTLVRPWFDFGFSPTQYAGGKSKGELGGTIFRGDCRYPERMACYGDAVGPLTLKQPLRASGKIAMRRGVSDSTTFFGFYNSKDSMRQNESQKDALAESILGIHIEGPSSEGFCFYPVYRAKGRGGMAADVRAAPRIYPDGKSHDWSLIYDPTAGNHGRITVTIDDQSSTLDLKPSAQTSDTQFDRFGIVTTWIDGNSQDVYWDDVVYTVR